MRMRKPIKNHGAGFKYGIAPILPRQRFLPKTHLKTKNKCPLTGGTQKASPAAYEQIPGGLSKISSSDETAEIPMLIKNLVAIWRYLAITIAKL